MSTVKVYQCDGPGCEVLAAPHEHSQDLPPEEWWRVKRVYGDELHFHNLLCLMRWAQLYREPVEEDAEGELRQ